MSNQLAGFLLTAVRVNRDQTGDRPLAIVSLNYVVRFFMRFSTEQSTRIRAGVQPEF